MHQLGPTPKEQFLSKRQRYHPIALPDEFSDEELAHDWTLTRADIEFLAPFSRCYRVLNAIQLRSIRLYGRFLDDIPIATTPEAAWPRSSYRPDKTSVIRYSFALDPRGGPADLRCHLANPLNLIRLMPA